MCATCGCSTDVEQAHGASEHPDSDHSEIEGSHPNPHELEHAHHHSHELGHAHNHSHELEHSHHHPHHEHLHADHHLHGDHAPEVRHLSVQLPPRMLTLERELLEKNSRLAERNRGWFEGKEILTLNFTSSPGSGKTTLLERTIRALGDSVIISVIEGDQETVRDAERIRATGCRVIQINTGTGCHLDAQMVADSLRELNPPINSILMIENVGNLVCPALFDLGEHAKVVIMSVTEGEDKPLKYLHMFRASKLMLLNKVDLLPHLDFEVDRCLDYARQVNPRLEILQVSATRGDGMQAWFSWLRQQLPKTGPAS